MLIFQRINTLEVDLSEARRHIVRKERALDTVQKGMEALARGKQQESEAKGEQVTTDSNPCLCCPIAR